MKILLFGLLVILSLGLNAQVEVIKKSNVKTLGIVEKYETPLAQSLIYSMRIEQHADQEGTYFVFHLDNCRATFHGTRADLIIIYETVLQDLRNMEYADTEIKLGDETLRVHKLHPAQRASLEVETLKRIDWLPFKLGDCSIQLHEKEWIELFKNI